MGHWGSLGDPWGRWLCSLLHCLWELHTGLSPPFSCVYSYKAPALCGLLHPHYLTSGDAQLAWPALHRSQDVRLWGGRETMALSNMKVIFWKKGNCSLVLPPQHSVGQQNPRTSGDWHVGGLAYWYQQVVEQLRLGTCYFLLVWPGRENPSTMENREHTVLWEAEVTAWSTRVSWPAWSIKEKFLLFSCWHWFEM